MRLIKKQLKSIRFSQNPNDWIETALADEWSYLQNKHGYTRLKKENIGMQSRNIDEMSDFIINELCNYFNEKVKGFVISNLVDDVNHKSFVIEFNAYDYFPLVFNYDMGRMGCAICFGTRRVELKNSQKWWDEADFDVFFKELKEELELRIPDKFLKVHGWL